MRLWGCRQCRGVEKAFVPQGFELMCQCLLGLWWYAPPKGSAQGSDVL